MAKGEMRLSTSAVHICLRTGISSGNSTFIAQKLNWISWEREREREKVHNMNTW